MNAPVEQTLVVLMFEEWMMRELTELVKAAYDESAVMHSFSYSERRVQEMIALAIFAPERVCGIAHVDLKNKEVIGALIATVSGVGYSEEPTVSDIFSYIKPEYRHNPESRGALIESYLKWCERSGVKKVFFFNTRLSGDAELDGWAHVGERLMRELR